MRPTHKPGLRTILLQVTEPLAQAIDVACGLDSRNAKIEGWLWRIKDVRDAAKAAGIEREARRGRGRPPESGPDTA